jgi:hypothetical protein
VEFEDMSNMYSLFAIIIEVTYTYATVDRTILLPNTLKIPGGMLKHAVRPSQQSNNFVAEHA